MRQCRQCHQLMTFSLRSKFCKASIIALLLLIISTVSSSTTGSLSASLSLKSPSSSSQALRSSSSYSSSLSSPHPNNKHDNKSLFSTTIMSLMKRITGNDNDIHRQRQLKNDDKDNEKDDKNDNKNDDKNDNKKSKNSEPTLPPTAAPSTSPITQTKPVSIPPFVMKLTLSRTPTSSLSEITLREITRTFLMFRYDEEFTPRRHDLNFIVLDIFNTTGAGRRRRLEEEEETNTVVTRIFMGSAYFRGGDGAPNETLVGEVTTGSFGGSREEIFIELLRISQDPVLRTVRSVTVASMDRWAQDTMDAAASRATDDDEDDDDGSLFFDRKFLYIWIAVGVCSVGAVAFLLVVVARRQREVRLAAVKALEEIYGEGDGMKIPTTIKRPTNGRSMDAISDIAMSDLNSTVSGFTNIERMNNNSNADAFTVNSEKYAYSLAGTAMFGSGGRESILGRPPNETFDTESNSDSMEHDEIMAVDDGDCCHNDGMSSTMEGMSMMDGMSSMGLSTMDMSRMDNKRFNAVLGFDSESVVADEEEKPKWNNNSLSRKMTERLSRVGRSGISITSDDEEIEVGIDRTKGVNGDDSDDSDDEEDDSRDKKAAF